MSYNLEVYDADRVENPFARLFVRWWVFLGWESSGIHVVST